MRILAIRGCNLASLAGEFEIDLSRAPLGDAGVFAIVGNTGAGKSTLLDALCVALFDRTPRLTNHSRVVVGRGAGDPGALGAQDVRTLLRRGAASGWAEVDFESGDLRRYRSRWSVRRARGQTDGTLQDQQITLTAIDGGERLGGTKTETLKAIVARLGLSFDQFRRSALLAQGEFAAFLRADGRDRSELLERMTGTEIYSRLSIAAHVKATSAVQQLDRGRAAALAIPVLDDEARAAAEAELAEATAARAAARARHGAVEEAARWLAEAERRQHALGEAEAATAASRSGLAAADDVRRELAQRRRAEPLRAAWEAASRALGALEGIRREAGAAEVALGEAAAAQATIEQRRAALRELHEPVRAARRAAGVVERVASADAATELARAAAPDAAWLVARAALAGEIAGWSELDAQFAQHAALGDAIAGLDRALKEAAGEQARLTRERGKLAGEQQAATARLGEAQRKAEGYHRRRNLPLDVARKQEDAARTRLHEVERLVAIAEGARQAVAVRDEMDHQLADAAGAGRSEAETRARLEAAQGIALVQRSERAAIVEELRRAAGYAHARAELRDGEACPLCGAAEHPWRDRGAFDDVIRDAELRLAEVAVALDAGTLQLAALEARAQQRERDTTRLVSSRATAVASAEAAVGKWREQLTALGELLLEGEPSSPGAIALAADREAGAKKALDEARAARHATEAATKAAQEAQAEVQLAQATVDNLTAQVADHDRKLADAAASVARQRGERATRVERQAELAAILDAAIARYRAALPAPSVTHAAARRVRAVEEPLPAEHDAARAALADLAAAWRARAERIALADAAAVAALAAIEREAQQALGSVAEHTARHAEARRRAAALEGELVATTTTLEAARQAAELAPDELRRLLAAPAAVAEELASQLAALERAAELALAVVHERRRLVADHAAARPASVAALEADIAAIVVGRPASEIDIAAHVAAVAALAAQADEHASSLTAMLTADRGARARRDAALAALATEEAEAEVDRVLASVIGSHDGKLFRSYAQSLTLDGLLAVANGHLEELAPRYQLERVPRHDLELQVIDRDLGAEVRSVQSLSGGESFLVSLALALGLSSMSAHDVRVRTLLIDEGFGTLDPATLDAALSVLDALQATGRQVGIISHVPGLTERVGAHIRVVQRGGGRSEVVVP